MRPTFLGKIIHAQIQGVFQGLLPKLNEHFAASTFAAVKKEQVTIARKAWRPDGDPNASYNIYLEIDEEADQWLQKSLNRFCISSEYFYH